MPDRKIAIITDSTCDIPADLIERYAIRALPQIVIWPGAGDQHRPERAGALRLRGVGTDEDLALSFGAAAGFGAVEVTNVRKVVVDIAAGGHGWADADDLLAVVDIAKHNRHARPGGDVIETRAPVFRPAARALRSDQERQPLAAVEDAYHLLDELIARAPVDRDAAQGAHQRAQRAFERGVFADPVKL